MKISVLLEPCEAMKEAVKMQTREIWLSGGMLTRRCQDFPLESYIIETVDPGTGIEFQGWSKKVSQVNIDSPKSSRSLYLWCRYTALNWEN